MRNMLDVYSVCCRCVFQGPVSLLKFRSGIITQFFCQVSKTGVTVKMYTSHPNALVYIGMPDVVIVNDMLTLSLGSVGKIYHTIWGITLVTKLSSFFFFLNVLKTGSCLHCGCDWVMVFWGMDLRAATDVCIYSNACVFSLSTSTPQQ